MITKFESMVDDTIDSTLALQLVNDAKNEIEGMIAWEQLKRELIFSVNTGYTYATAATALPTRFALPVRMVEFSSYLPYDKFDYDDLHARVNAPYGYYIDLANGNLHLTGTGHTAKTMYFFYTTYSADLEEDDTWVFPSRFHSVIPLKMAQLYYAVDAGEKGRAWDDRWNAEYERKVQEMYSWNDKLKLANRSQRNTSRAISPRAV